MRNGGIRVLVAMVVALLASVAMPVGRNSAAAQNWEVAGDGLQVAFDRRDDQGRIYYQLRRVYPDGRPTIMGAYPNAADCSKGLLYRYNVATKNWETPMPVTEGSEEGSIKEGRVGIRSVSGVAYKYVCGKYGR
jgi:opacity protein-like surface antigen